MRFIKLIIISANEIYKDLETNTHRCARRSLQRQHDVGTESFSKILASVFGTRSGSPDPTLNHTAKSILTMTVVKYHALT